MGPLSSVSPDEVRITTASKGANELMDAKLKVQFAASFPDAVLKNIKWYPAVPAGIEDIEGRVLDRVKAAN